MRPMIGSMALRRLSFDKLPCPSLRHPLPRPIKLLLPDSKTQRRGASGADSGWLLPNDDLN